MQAALPLFRFFITPAEGPAFDHLLRGDSLVVGRASDADLVLSDPFLSRRHSRFFRSGSELFVEDLGSRNGTLVNDQPVKGPMRLRPGDVVRISNSTLALALDQAEPGPPASAGDGETLDASHEDGTIFLRASELLDRQESPAPDRLRNEAGFTRYAERLKLLNTVHQALGRSLTREKLLDLILDLVFGHLRPDRGAVLLREADGAFRPAASRSVTGPAQDLRFSRSLVREVTEKGMAALVLDVQQDERFAKSHSMMISGIRSLVAAPLLDPEGTLGLIVLESRVQTRQFKEEDLELLVSLASVAALHLRNLELALEAAERQRLEEELALARRIQVALLPSQLPEVPGWDLHGDNFPSRGVSGDYYEVVERRARGEGTDDPECVLIVADVSGKGMAASLLTVSLQALSAVPVEDGLPPEEICDRLSRQLYRRTPPEKYATAFLAALDPATGRVRYTNAGHNPGLVVRSGGQVETLGTTGVPLGLVPFAPPYRAGETVLAPGDTLVLYTDGIVEAMDPDGEEYGLERLMEICRERCVESSCRDLAEAVEEDLAAFVRGVPFADDRTLVMARRLAGQERLG